MKKLLLLLFITTSITTFAQPTIEGMYAYTDVNVTTPLDSVQACDSIYFVVNLNTSTPSSNYGILVDGSYYESYAYSLMQQYPVGGGYKVFFRIPCNFAAHSFHDWEIGASNTTSIYVYAAQPTGITQAIQNNKEGTISIHDVQGRFIKTSPVQDYLKGLQPGILYIYSATYSDNTFDKGKFIIE